MGIDVEMEDMTLPIIVINPMACLKDWRDFRKFPTHFIRTDPSAEKHTTAVKEAKAELFAPRVPTLVLSNRF